MKSSAQEDLDELLNQMTPEQMEALKQKILMKEQMEAVDSEIVDEAEVEQEDGIDE